MSTRARLDRVGAILMAVGFALPGAGRAGASPWLPKAGQLDVSAILLFEHFDESHRGEERVPFPFTRYDQVTARILDELESDSSFVPTLSLRMSEIIVGSYAADGSIPPAVPGDQASGLEVAFEAGRMIDHDIGLTAEVGLRARNEDVPLEVHLRVGVFKTFFDRLTLGFADDDWSATSGLEIAGPGFTPDRVRELQEISRSIEGSAGLSDGWGNFWSLYDSHTLSGRSTGAKHVATFAITRSF